MPFLPLDKLKTGASELGIALYDTQLALFDAFAELLTAANTKFNLTRITDPEAIVRDHYLDSLACLSAVELSSGSRVIDIGTGAGFPGVPLKLARPDLNVVMVDSTLKKIKFLQEAIERLEIEEVELIHTRAEDLAHDCRYREKFDATCCRALADLAIASELCVPFVRAGGRMIAQKSKDIDEEIAAARPIIGQLGGNVEKIVRIKIPGTNILRSLVVVQKARPTPIRFPRSYAQIARKKKIHSI